MAWARVQLELHSETVCEGRGRGNTGAGRVDEMVEDRDFPIVL